MKKQAVRAIYEARDIINEVAERNPLLVAQMIVDRAPRPVIVAFVYEALLHRRRLKEEEGK